MQIVFDGMITGATEKRFWQKERIFGIKLLLIVFTMISPIIYIMSKSMQNDLAFKIIIAAMPILILTVFIPKSKKEKMSLNPKKIVINGDMITCTANSYVESKFIDDVKEVRVHEEFYELVFPWGKISNKFMCQKSLLTKGSLAEFEELFKDKLIIKK